MREDFVYFIAGEHDRQARGLPGALDVLKPSDFLFEHLFVKKQECAKSLVLCRNRDVPGPCKMSQKLRHLCLSHLSGMTHSVEPDKAGDPVAVGAFGAQAVMFQPDYIPHLIEQFSFGLARSGTRR